MSKCTRFPPSLARPLFGESSPHTDKPTFFPISVRGRPHYYSQKKEEYAIIKFSLEADLSSLFTWNTKQLFVYVTAEWPSAGGSGSGQNATNQAVIWDSIITSPSADHLANLGPIAMRKLKRSAQGKSIDPSRYVYTRNTTPFFYIYIFFYSGRLRGLLETDILTNMKQRYPLHQEPAPQVPDHASFRQGCRAG